MKSKYLILLSVAVVMAVSCKKEEENTSKLFMTGKVTYEMPTYVLTETEMTVTASGITAPQNPTYYWVSPDMNISDNDTLVGRTVTFRIPETPGTYNLEVFAEADGYYVSTTETVIHALSTEDNSVEGLEEGSRTITDGRDGEEYQVREMGSLVWFVENLRYAGTEEAPIGAAYENSESIAAIFGRLYTWDEATGGVTGEGVGGGPQGACPDGWSVPTKEDWEDLALAHCGEKLDFLTSWDNIGSMISAPITLNDEAMWPYSPDNTHSNTLGWNGMPIGNSFGGHNWFENVSLYGMWWSSALNDNGQAGYRYVYYNTGSLNPHFINRDDYGVTVRCVKLI